MEEKQRLECVGKMEVKRSSHVSGFICGTLPVPTFQEDGPPVDALVPLPHPHSHPPQRAPRYRMLPTETDLNMPPSADVVTDEFVPTPTADSYGSHRGWGSSPFTQPLARKCESLAVSGLAEYGDEIDVVAPVDILKQIFKIPYSKARLSVAVHRIGQTLILNTGPDVEEGENLIRKKKNHSKGIDQSLFLNFAMHSVRAEACDCPPSSNSVPENTTDPTDVSEHSNPEFEEEECLPTVNQQTHSSWKFINTDEVDDNRGSFPSQRKGHSQKNRDSVTWGCRKTSASKGSLDALKKRVHACEKQCPQNCSKDSEKYCRLGNEGFLRVLFWKFHKLRMLLGSDLLVFSNEKHVAVSLHLWDVKRQVTPLMWLDAWLDNLMASVPELAICYHHNGVVQGYELLKTDDIYLLKGISEDGTTAFHPQVVQQNGLSVLKFLQENCKQDPGSYWLYKNSGEDVMQLFDLSVISKTCPDKDEASCSSLPSSKSRRQRDYSLSLGILLYRLAHRLSFSKVPTDMSKCAKLFKKCLEFLNGRDHLLVRACAHEQVARLILKCYEDLGSTMETLLLECDTSNSDFKNVIEEIKGSPLEDMPLEKTLTGANLIREENSGTVILEKSTCSDVSVEERLAVCQVEETSKLVRNVKDPITAKLAAIHHVSQAIKSLRWKRQLQDNENVLDADQKSKGKSFCGQNFLVCICGDVDCIEVCDVREWLAGYRVDRKLWQLVLLLGESYLALAQAYKDCEELLQAVKVTELACTVYGSMPSSLEEIEYISAVEGSTANLSSLSHNQVKERDHKNSSHHIDISICCEHSNESKDRHNEFGRKGLFWGRAYTLVGDFYVECQRLQGERKVDNEERSLGNELKMASEVLKEVKRLRKKLGQGKRNCNICCLTNCSCQSDRASSGNSASSSRSEYYSSVYDRKKNKRINNKNMVSSKVEISERDSDQSNCKANAQHSKQVGKQHDMSATAENEKKSDGILDFKKDDNLSKQTSGVCEAPKSKESQIADKHGDIFGYIEGLKTKCLKDNLLAAAECYDFARDALNEMVCSEEFQSATRKKGWVYNELGRQKLALGDLKSAENFFATAISSFREVKDFTNIILINCNLGHGRRAVAESLVAKIDSYKQCGIVQSAYKETLDEAKLQYSQALKCYCAARLELDAACQRRDLLMDGLKNEVYTQYAHTYLRLGMFLVREQVAANVFADVSCKETPLESAILNENTRENNCQRKIEISGSDAIREALSLYESLGTLRLQEAAFANFQLACCHKDTCLKILNGKGNDLLHGKPSTHLQKAKRYASLAERYWLKAMVFYHAESHPDMFLQILMERSALSQALSLYYSPNMMLESALSYLLEGRHITSTATKGSELDNHNVVSSRTIEQFSMQLQSLLKTMLAGVCNTAKNNNRGGSFQSKRKKDPQNSYAGDMQGPSARAVDVEKLRHLYRIALKCDQLPDLVAMYTLWSS